MLLINELIENDHLDIDAINAIYKNLQGVENASDLVLHDLMGKLTVAEDLENKRNKLLQAFQKYTQTLTVYRTKWDKAQEDKTYNYPLDADEINDYYNNSIIKNK